jgi:hypothetical protein
VCAYLKLEIAKRIAGFSVGLQKMRNWIFWRGRPPPKQKNKLHIAQQPIMQKRLALGIVLPPPLEREKKKKTWMKMLNLDLPETYHDAARDERTRRGSGGSGWRVVIANRKNYNPKHRSRGKEDVTSTNLRKEGTVIHR